MHRALRTMSVVATLLLTITTALVAQEAAAAVDARWTGAKDHRADLAHVIAKLNGQTGLKLTEADFRLGEDRELAFSHYRRYDQVVADINVRDMAIRVWTTKHGERLIQVEARVEAPTSQPAGVIELESVTSELQETAVMKVVQSIIRASGDQELRGVSVEHYWQAGRLVAGVEAKARRGVHSVEVDALTFDVIAKKYQRYPRADLTNGARTDEFSVPALVYPVYEEFGGELLTRQPAELKYIKRNIARPTDDPFGVLADRHYYYRMHDRVRGETPDGQAQGYWSMNWLRRQIAAIQTGIPVVPNEFAKDGVLLAGRYATINIHPAAFTAFPGVTLPLTFSSQALFSWREDTANDDWEIVPGAAGLGQALLTERDAWLRDATRHPEHDPAAYINSGFDEVQVYYGINQTFDALRPMGFVDPDLGERPFHAFLFDPDIESRDNAYYTDDTINFTTYTPAAQNYARDNTTIWHELGHGIMDRLMGDRLRLADTGGLSEGMADFVAELVLQATTDGAAFPGQSEQRIINQTGFFLTNEVHDDGEAYGGVMKDILDAALARYGRVGLHKVTDLVLEAMRLSRDHPELTADVWFERMKFADELGRKGVRRPRELSSLIDGALASRNFAAADSRGVFGFSHQGESVDAGTPGSRDNEIELHLAPDAESTHQLVVELSDGAGFQFQYPAEVRVFFNSGPLQGAIDWVGEDNEPHVYVVNGPNEPLTIDVTARGTCDEINRGDGSCSDFVYVQVFGRNATKPVAKKRFYLRVYPEAG